MVQLHRFGLWFFLFLQQPNSRRTFSPCISEYGLTEATSASGRFCKWQCCAAARETLTLISCVLWLQGSRNQREGNAVLCFICFSNAFSPDFVLFRLCNLSFFPHFVRVKSTCTQKGKNTHAITLMVESFPKQHVNLEVVVYLLPNVYQNSSQKRNQTKCIAQY